MGLIKSIFGAIFGVLSGLFKAIGSLVGLGKKSEFYLELNEAESGSQPEADPVATAPASAATPEPAVTVAAPAPTPAPVAAPQPAQPAAPVPSFAATYLATAGTDLPSRRRPGPSLSPFVDMAKQMKA